MSNKYTHADVKPRNVIEGEYIDLDHEQGKDVISQGESSAQIKQKPRNKKNICNLPKYCWVILVLLVIICAAIIAGVLIAAQHSQDGKLIILNTCTFIVLRYN